MTSLVLAAFFFFAIHGLVSATGLRRVLVARIGENAYRGIFSLASVAGLAWLIHAYATGTFEAPPLWETPEALRPVVVVAMLPLLVLGIAGLTMRNPTSVGQEKALAAEEPAQGVLRITRHPFLVAVTGWAGLHALMNGDPPSLVLFGTMLLIAVLGMRSIDAKRAAADGAAWTRYAAVTSRLPFAAIFGGRNRFSVAEIGWPRLLAGFLAWAVLLHYHGTLFGMPAVAS